MQVSSWGQTSQKVSKDTQLPISFLVMWHLSTVYGKQHKDVQSEHYCGKGRFFDPLIWGLSLAHCSRTQKCDTLESETRHSEERLLCFYHSITTFLILLICSVSFGVVVPVLGRWAPVGKGQTVCWEVSCQNRGGHRPGGVSTTGLLAATRQMTRTLCSSLISCTS